MRPLVNDSATATVHPCSTAKAAVCSASIAASFVESSARLIQQFLPHHRAEGATPDGGPAQPQSLAPVWTAESLVPEPHLQTEVAAMTARTRSVKAGEPERLTVRQPSQ
jgi:hypothetical protein